MREQEQAAPSSRPAVSPAGIDDAALVAAIARGDKRAVAALYDRYAGVVLAIGLRVLGDRRAAEDLVHDVFLEVWRAAGDYDPGRGSVKVWLCMRARSRSLDRLRSAGRASIVPIEEAPAAEAERATEADASALAERVAVRTALAALPAEQRQVIELGYYEGLSSSEIAEQLGIPMGTVKSRVAAAMRRLREVLGDGGGP